MKSFKVAKMNINALVKPTAIYYGVIVTILVVCIISNLRYPGTVQNSGVEMATVIFLFVCGLNSFKSNFYFAKSNNISRKVFMKGLLLSSVPLVLATSIMDLLINRVTNIFVKMPTLYDMGFGNLNGINYSSLNFWTQSNSFETILKTMLFQITYCLAAYLLGIVVNMIYYRCNKIMKTVVSIVPIVLMIVFGSLPNSIIEKVFKFMNYILGVDPINVFAPVTTFLIGAVILSLLSFILIRKAVIKERG